MIPTISLHTWISLTTEERARIRSIFGIPRSSHVIVNDGRIETDGTTPEDFSHLTIEKMQAYLGDKSTDFNKLFDKVLSRVKDEIEGRPVVVDVIPSEKKHGKKSK